MKRLPVCVDASLILRLVVEHATTPLVEARWRSWHENRVPIVAPALLFFEVANALYRYVVHKLLTPQEAAETLAVAMSFDVTLYDDQALYARALEIAVEASLDAAYDAHYVALAEFLGAEFWTADARLARLAPGHAAIRLLGTPED